MREGYVPLVVGVLDMAVFVPCMVLSFLSEWRDNGPAAAFIIAGLFGVFVLLGLALVLDFRNRRLVLSADECRYTTWLGRPRTFSVTDVARAEHALAVNNSALVLRDAGNKKLAQIETNMRGAAQALEWLGARGISVTERRLGALKPGEWNNPTWEPGDSWQAQHRRGIRLAVRILSGIAIVTALAGWLLLPPKVRRTCWLVLPLALLALYFAFAEVMVIEKPTTSTEKWKKAHLAFPLLPYAIVCLAALNDMRYIYLIDWGKCIALGTAIFAALLALFFRAVPKKRRGAATTGCVVIFLLLYAYMGVYHLNYVLRFAPPVHVSAAVVDNYVYEGSKTTSFYITLLPATGKRERYSVSYSMYERAVRERVVQLCRRESVLGIRFELIHAVTTDPAQ